MKVGNEVLTKSKAKAVVLNHQFSSVFNKERKQRISQTLAKALFRLLEQ